MAAGPDALTKLVKSSPVCRFVTQAGPLVGATIASRWFAASAVSIALRASVVAVALSWM